MKALELLHGLSHAELEAALLRRSLRDFACRFWPVVTGMELVENGATTAVLQALQRVADGETTRLLIALPPGTGKSTLLCLYAAWRLARDPSWRSIHASHSYEIAGTDSRRIRRLVESDEFRELFPAVMLRPDESTVAHWATTANGRYIAVGADGGLTGRRANEAVIDDPLNAIDRFSRAARESMWAWFCESLSTRLDGARAPIIVVQQRLDREDLIGRLIEAGGWELLELPAEREDGTLLAANVLPREKLDALKAQIGSAAYACQYLQRPSDDASAKIKRSWWRFHHAAHVSPVAPRPLGSDTKSPAVPTPDRFEQVVIAADLTFGSATGDFASVQAWGAIKAARYLLARFHKRCGLLESAAAIREMLAMFPGAKIVVEKAANGAGVVEELQQIGVSAKLVPPLGSKGYRVSLVSGTIEAGNCFLPLGLPDLGDFIEELAGATKHDDEQDAAAYAIHELNATYAPSVMNLERGPFAQPAQQPTDRFGRPIGGYR